MNNYDRRCVIFGLSMDESNALSYTTPAGLTAPCLSGDTEGIGAVVLHVDAVCTCTSTDTFRQQKLTIYSLLFFFFT